MLLRRSPIYVTIVLKLRTTSVNVNRQRTFILVTHLLIGCVDDDFKVPAVQQSREGSYALVPSLRRRRLTVLTVIRQRFHKNAHVVAKTKFRILFSHQEENKIGIG